MEKLRFWALPVTLTLLFNTPYILAQAGQDVCLAMVTDAAHSVNLNTSSNTYYSSLFKSYCKADGSTDTSAIGGSASAIIEEIPVGIKGNSNDAKTQWETFCNNEKDVVASSSDTFGFSSLVVSQALSSANQCLAIVKDHAATLTYKIETADRMVINLGIPSGQSIVVHGINADAGISCSGTDLKKGGQLTYAVGTGQTISANSGATSIGCTRKPFASVGGQDHFKEAAVFVDTSYGPLNIYWPQDTTLPIMSATAIQANITSLQNQVQTVTKATDFNSLPVGTILPWTRPGGAAIPQGWSLADGSNGTPDLRSLFLRAAAPGEGIGNVGGADSHKHVENGQDGAWKDGGGFSRDGEHWKGYTEAANNIPRYYAVAYIIKISAH